MSYLSETCTCLESDFCAVHGTQSREPLPYVRPLSEVGSDNAAQHRAAARRNLMAQMRPTLVRVSEVMYALQAEMGFSDAVKNAAYQALLDKNWTNAIAWLVGFRLNVQVPMVMPLAAQPTFQPRPVRAERSAQMVEVAA